MINRSSTSLSLLDQSPLLAFANIPPADELLTASGLDETNISFPLCVPGQRLGYWFEDRVAEIIDASSRLRLVARNLQIHDDQRTLGELDMLVEDRHRQCLMHWELSLKFYLGISPGFWPGPNQTDNLHHRAGHLLHQQLTRLQLPETQRFLVRQGWRVNEQRLFSRGRLFYPANPLDTALTTPDFVHPNHERGYWWSLNCLLDEHRSQWLLVDKSHWPAPLSMSDNNRDWLATSQVIDYVKRLPAPAMALCRQPDSRPDERPVPGFLVPQQWLDNARQQESCNQ